MASSRGDHFSQQSLYYWDSTFDSGQKLSDKYDEPFAKAFSEHDSASDFISFFMRECDENEACNYATRVVRGFCQDADLAGLQQNIRATTEPVALLDDGVGATALDLYEALLKPKKKNRKGKGAETTARQQMIRTTDQDGGIKRVYIPNLTSWAVIALAASAPNYQAGILGEFIFNHLRFDHLIHANIQREHIPSFALEFQLPYFVLREHRLPQEDARRLRGYQDITFLRNMGDKLDNSPTRYIYDTKLSLLISGTGSHSWTGFLLDDRYFGTDDEPESIAEYLDQGSAGLMPDPFAAGKKPMGDLPCDPREHFLIAFETYLSRVNKEMWHVFMALDEDIRSYEKNYWDQKICRVSYNANDHQRNRLGTDKSRSQLRKDHQEWMRRVVGILRKHIGILNQYSDERKMFSDHGQNYFMPTDNVGRLNRLRKSLAAVDQQFTRLERLLNKYKHTLDCCEDISRVFNHRIALEDNESALFQQKTARDVKVLTWITFLSLPITLAASLLSTQAGYIPINPSPGALLASIAVLEVVVWLVLGSLLGWDWFRKKMKIWLPYQFRSRKTGIQEAELQQAEGLT
ncbi:uncharacterized protein F4807DRAFT_469206 [Annulohypoxylon truncatum]|uniref:uncharacterized protein n=1 Tax=Annulohypoxylon truncatum TaxID=327061 RepID=UPI00200822DD|nr:uncharacterized protein F4807DRAFT_469206 [Annulohypoxylon truncatum]KAI1207689.1 hypothetical protein F4807DRAFT_469206 [Annulohypoxylon truncatum]